MACFRSKAVLRTTDRRRRGACLETAAGPDERTAGGRDSVDVAMAVAATDATDPQPLDRQVQSRWQQSGLTAEHFGRREGLDPRQLRWWKRSLGKRTAAGEGASVTSFLPVRVVAAAPTAAPSPVEIVLGNGRRVRVLGPVDPDVLASVLEAAERT
ncbi:MAG TPA: hypothetical protein VFS43_33720 [Polyangiaceae bacterium]|nr:hypothetical protein [Polyangiaceae bacterium]